MVFSSEGKMKKNNFRKKLRRALQVFLLGALILAGTIAPYKRAEAQMACTMPNVLDTVGAAVEMVAKQEIYENLLMVAITAAFTEMRNWFTSTFFEGQVLPALQLFTQQMSAVAMHQAMIIGTFLDAKEQLETQRLLQELQTQAHKDYHPSEDFCWFGTSVRNMAASEQIGKINAVALSAAQLGRQLGNKNMAAATSRDDDKTARWKQFQKKYCDPKDNNFTVEGTGLEAACGKGGGNTRRINIDIDYTRTIDEPRTLDVNFTNGSAGTEAEKNDEEDVIALGNNLYGHDVLSHIDAGALANSGYQHLYLALRSVAAKRSVAQNSYDAIVGLKSSGSSSGAPPGAPAGTAASGTNKFLGAVLTELGVPAADVYKIIGEDPSYYAQLEILAKKIYQNPDFYANLYDKPANIARKSVALKAIELMLDRAIFESQLRQEMATSVLLSANLHKSFEKVNAQLGGGN
jgi:hypothetical protein